MLTKLHEGPAEVYGIISYFIPHKNKRLERVAQCENKFDEIWYLLGKY